MGRKLTPIEQAARDTREQARQQACQQRARVRYAARMARSKHYPGLGVTIRLDDFVDIGELIDEATEETKDDEDV